jgi:hypothetical protein
MDHTAAGRGRRRDALFHGRRHRAVCYCAPRLSTSFASLDGDVISRHPAEASMMIRVEEE